QKIFGGKSASQVATDPAQQVKLLAALLLLELSTDQVTSDFDFNELRAKLGLPKLEIIDPKATNLAELPLVRLARVDLKALTDEQSVDLFRRADHYRHITALRTLAHEVLARPSLDAEVDKA